MKSFQCYPSRAHGKSEGTPVGAMNQSEDVIVIVDFRDLPAGGGVLFWQGTNSLFIKNSTTMILYSSSSPEPFKTFALFAASLEKPLPLD